MEPERHCSATLIAPDVVLTAAHCVVRFGVGTEGICTPMLPQWSEFIASDGVHYQIDLDNRRAYVPGLYHVDTFALSSVRGRKHGECFQGPNEP